MGREKYRNYSPQMFEASGRKELKKKKKNNSTPLTSLAFTACNVDLRINVVHLRGGERKLSGVCG